jgi:tRNA pseudouridine55 synthase
MVEKQITGILNIDKPAGPTSHDVVHRVRQITGIRRVGHAGTLDPLATGVLILAAGRATRLLEYIVGQPKTYWAQLHLGQTTTTYDAEGEIITDLPVTVSEAEFQAALPPFRGDITQIPPMYSAIKREGKPLYELARQGVEVERPPRPVTIYTLELLHWSPPLVALRVSCSAGTYIRSLAHDVGAALGCGAYLAGLRRTAVGTFTADSAINLESLTTENWTAHLLPPDSAVVHLPRLDVDAEMAGRLSKGQRIPRTPEHPAADLVRVYNPAGEFIGLVTTRENQWQPRKMWR